MLLVLLWINIWGEKNKMMISPLDQPASNKGQVGPHLLSQGVHHHQVGVLHLAMLVGLIPGLLGLRKPVAAAFVSYPVKGAAGPGAWQGKGGWRSWDDAQWATGYKERRVTLLLLLLTIALEISQLTTQGP